MSPGVVPVVVDTTTDLTNGTIEVVGTDTDNLIQHDFTEGSPYTSSASPPAAPSHPSTNIYVHIPQSTSVNPKSRYTPFTPPAPPADERTALDALMRALEREGKIENLKEDFIEFELDQFAFYTSANLYPHELRPLHHLAAKKGANTFFFDGILSLGEVKFYLTEVEVVELPVGNYGDDFDSVGGEIWVRSRMNAQEGIFYKLKRPATEYIRYHLPFLWIADLAKHVVDFCSWKLEKKGKVISMSVFNQEFIKWASQKHKRSPSFQRWREQHPSDDFRTSVQANIDYIWKEMNGVIGPSISGLPLFKETIHFSRWEKSGAAPRKVKIREGKHEVDATIVTPYIMKCFGHMVLGKVLMVGGPEGEKATLEAKEESRRPVPHHPPKPRTGGTRRRVDQACDTFLSPEEVDLIQVGDMISTPRDHEEATDTKWQRMLSEHEVDDEKWYGLVQGIHVNPRTGSKSFDVTWFYRPHETPCCMMRYPWANELFLSDHCTCEDGASARVKASEVLATHSVDWFGDPENPRPGAEFVVRQYYTVERRRWTTLEKSHLRCTHGPPKPWFRVGETVLAAPTSSETRLEAYEVIKIFKQDGRKFVRLRKLVRRKEVDSQDAAPNELVYTDLTTVMNEKKIVSKCYVRFFKPGTPIPVPYNRGGTGNLFFITSQLRVSADGASMSVVPFEDDLFPQSLRQGFDPQDKVLDKLQGMDLFCGSGNFGRGLEEGGVVEMRWANDIWDRAIHTYMANAPSPADTKPFLGSVDDLLQLALLGKFSDKVPRPGEVEFISGGSPCPGFSLLVADKTVLTQVKNQSLVASFASFVDFYRPKYGILENVTTIVQSKENRRQDVLSQLFCALVGMGYQAQLIMGDAWSHGTPQSRSRVFLYFAAKGSRLPEAPVPSHGHSDKTKNHALGTLCNGEPFVSRKFDFTPFDCPSAGEATADLVPIYDGAPDSCVPFPDHRLSIGITYERRREIKVIPTHPAGMGFVSTWNNGKGVMTPAERELFPPDGHERVAPNSTGWTRVKPGDLFPTVTTACNPTDARLSAGLHWSEDRPISIQEVRRAQGFPDEEVLLGNKKEQWKLVGNSVARQMAIALGLQFRKAVLGSLYDDASGTETGPGSRASGSELASGAHTPISMISQSILVENVQASTTAVAINGIRTHPAFRPLTAAMNGFTATQTSASESDSSRGQRRKRQLSTSLAAEVHVRRVRMNRRMDMQERAMTPAELDDPFLDRDDTPATSVMDRASDMEIFLSGGLTGGSWPGTETPATEEREEEEPENENKINGVTIVRLETPSP
ncbi:hypothetical protein V8F20_011156 [Naviculisporaceae sp. PSN 640]